LSILAHNLDKAFFEVFNSSLSSSLYATNIHQILSSGITYSSKVGKKETALLVT
jgi:hypothetical protein